jgi:uncharacterized glyoxalase superfamily protein PhnB
MRINNLTLWVQDNEISTKFYKKLGFKIIHADDTHSIMGLNGFEIILVSMRDDAEFAGDVFSADKGKGVYIYVGVQNADAAYMELTKKGVQPATEPRDWPWGAREFIVKDPDGYKFCFSAPQGEWS